MARLNFQPIGALSGAVLNYFNRERKKYPPIPVREQVEVAALTGDVALSPESKPILHIHTVLGRRDSTALAGHLTEAHVRPTLEVVLTEAPVHLRRCTTRQAGWL